MSNRGQADSIVDTIQEQLRIVQEKKSHPESKVLSDLKKRKLIVPQKIISYEFKKGPKYAKEFVREDTDLTIDMLTRQVRRVIHDSGDCVLKMF